MKVQSDTTVTIETCNSEVSLNEVVERCEMTNKTDKRKHLHNPEYVSQGELEEGSQHNSLILSTESAFSSTELSCTSGELSNGTSLTETFGNPDCQDDSREEEGLSDIAEENRSKDCKHGVINEDEDLSYELQQAYRIFHGFLLEKHKAITAPFMHPMNAEEHVDSDRVQPPMWFRRIEEKFMNKEYETITDFVADFRRMLENCYRIHGVDHWISKQAQKLEIMLEQKLTLLSRTLREKTSLAVTSKGRFGMEDEKGIGSTSTRRRSMPRNLSNLTMGASESIMVQALRLEEQQRAKEEKRQREQEKKEAEEASAKELDEWEQSLLAQASPWSIGTLWELPAIGHFLCLAQTALNLPEIVFFELERCLLMPRCSTFLAKVMTSLLCHPQRRATLHRRPTLTYRRWEAALRQKVLGWYQAVGRAEDPGAGAEQLGLCPQLFRILGEVSPLEEKPFHLLPFNQRVWLLKGLCDYVYENQKEVQDAVLGQPIHECRESILGYDGHDNAYIHFPHFCGADLRIYCQSPCSSPNFPFPAIRVKKLEREDTGDGETKEHQISTGTGQQEAEEGAYNYSSEVKEEDCNTTRSAIHQWKLTKGLTQDGEDTALKAEPDQKGHRMLHSCREDGDSCDMRTVKEEPTEVQHSPEVKNEGRLECVKMEHCKPNLQSGEGQKSNKRMVPTNPREACHVAVPPSPREASVQSDRLAAKAQEPCPACSTNANPKQAHPHRCPKAAASKAASPQCSPRDALPEGKSSQLRTKKKKRKKKKVKEEGVQEGHGKPSRTRRNLVKAFKNNLLKAATTEKKKGKRKKRKLGKKIESKKVAAKKRKTGPKLPVEPTFQLVCTSLEELRELISKTEDELDELESTKKKSGRWYFRREAVKDLHITLIRLLNELSPWEPKLVKAFQRNRARLKKDYDDFKKHPEYDNFVREEWTGEDGDGSMNKDSHSSTDNARVAEGEEKQDQAAKKDVVAAEDSKQQGMEILGRTRAARRESVASDEHKPQLRNSKRRQSGSTDEELTPRKKNKSGSEDQTSSVVQTEVKAKELNAAAQSLATETSRVTTPAAIFHKGNTPIQALLAKSVGNKVTLISQPVAAAILASQVQNKPAVSLQTTKQSASPGQAQLPAPTPKSPVQAAHTMPGGLDLLRKSSSSPVKIAVQPVLDRKTGEKILQQVVILPSKLVIQRQQEKDTQHSQQQKVPVPVSKATVPLCNSSGFTRSNDANKIPVQQVAPLTEASSRSPSTANISPSLPTSVTSPFMVASVSKTGASQNIIASRTPVTSSTSANSNNPPDSKQELKTVCIRDSQSILVTTRGGNTGVVKVQSSDQNVPGSSPPSPVITISPQFQAFLVSKSSSPTASTPPALPSTTATMTPLTFNKSTPFVSPSQVPPTIPIPVSASQTGGTIVSFALTQPYNASNSSPLTQNKYSKPAQPSVVTNPVLPTTSQSNICVTTSCGKTGMIITPASLVQYSTRPPVKRAQPDERLADRPPFQKVILVTPPSSIAAPVATSKVVSPTASSAVPAPRLMLISQAPVTVDHSTVSIPKHTVSTDTKATSLKPASQVMDVKVGLNLSQIISNSATSTLQKVQTIGLLPDLTARLPGEALNMGKQVHLPPAESAAKSTCINASRAGLAASTSSGLIFVQTTSTPTGISPSSAETVGPTNVGEPLDGRTPALPTMKTGHLPSAAQQQGVSSSSTSSLPHGNDTKIRQAEASSPTAIVTTSVSGVINKDLALSHTPLAGSPTAGAVFGKPRFPAPVTKSFPFKISPVTAPHTSLHQACNTPTPSKTVSTPVAAPRPPLNPTVGPTNEPTATVQQRIVINTSTPLAPGTHIIINNTRFIVPAQGLGPGSHMLLISNPAVPQTAPQGVNPPSTAQKGTVSSGVQIPTVAGTSSPRKITPVAVPQHTTYGPPPPQSAVIEGPTSAPPIPQQVTTVGKSPVKSPLPVNCPTSIVQTSQFVAAAPTAHQGLLSPMRTTVLSADGKGMSVAALQALGNHVKNSIVMTVQPTGGAQNNVIPASLHTGLSNALPKTQLASSVQPAGSVISRTQVPPTATTLPVLSTVSRVQSLPVATVPPIGSAFSWRQACPIATVPPSTSSVIMAPCQPVKTARSEPVSTQQTSANLTHVLSKQVSSPVVLASPSSSKILVSPDGAILNAVRGTTLSNLPPVSKALTTVVVTTNSSAGRVLPNLKTDDTLSSTPADKAGPGN